MSNILFLRRIFEDWRLFSQNMSCNLALVFSAIKVFFWPSCQTITGKQCNRVCVCVCLEIYISIYMYGRDYFHDHTYINIKLFIYMQAWVNNTFNFIFTHFITNFSSFLIKMSTFLNIITVLTAALNAYIYLYTYIFEIKYVYIYV